MQQAPQKGAAVIKNKREWVGPFLVRDLLAHSIDDSVPPPPEHGSAYLVSKNAWSGTPTSRCAPLYVGGNTGQSARFRARLGDGLADAFGFWVPRPGHHSGGESVHRWCRDNRINPLSLYRAWVARYRCLEVDLVRSLSPILNRKNPARCKVHG